MKHYVAFVSRMSVFFGKACGVFYLAAIGLSIFEIFMRYAMGKPTAWTSETIMVLVATAWMLCVGAVTQQRRHITVTTMELLVGPKIWGRMKKVAIVLSMVGVSGLIIMLWDPMLKVINAPQTSGSAFDPPTPTYVKTMLVFAGFLYLLQLIANLFTPSQPADDTSESER